MPDHVNYSDNFITAVTILFLPFTIPFKELLCVWCIWRSLEGILKAQECKVNAWLLDPETCFYSSWLLVGEDFVQLPSKAAWRSLFRAICTYCIVLYLPSICEAWPSGLILRAVYSCGKPILVAKWKRFALGGDLNEKNGSLCVASLTLCSPAVL